MLWAAHRYRFKSTLGLEIDEMSTQRARLLFQSFQNNWADSKLAIWMECGDAAEWLLPQSNEPLLVFMFNPFGERTFEAFVSNNVEKFPGTTFLALANDHLLPTAARRLSDWKIWRLESRNMSIVQR
jgi:hypothetical protein